MKKFFLTLALLGAAAFSLAAAEPLLKMLPQGSCGVLIVELPKVWAHPAMQETLQKLQGVRDVAELDAKTGCRITDIDEILVFADASPDETGFVGALIRSRKAAKIMESMSRPDVLELINNSAGKKGAEKIFCKTERVAGKTVICFGDGSSSEKDFIGIVKVADDVLLVARRDILPKILAAPHASPETVARFAKLRIPGKSAVWGVWLDPEGKVEEDDNKQVEGKFRLRNLMMAGDT